MVRCKVCKVPLTGFLSIIGKTLFNIKPSSHDSQVCSKCVEKQINNQADNEADKLKGKKYKCQICERIVHEVHAVEHIKAEEYLMKLIKKDHPHWYHKEPTCKECIDYYRKLIKDAEI